MAKRLLALSVLALLMAVVATAGPTVATAQEGVVAGSTGLRPAGSGEDVEGVRSPEPGTVSEDEPVRRSTAEVAATQAQWLDGDFQYQVGYNCLTSRYENMITSYAGYYGTTDLSFPKVGNVYYGHIVLGTGGTCLGEAVHTRVFLPQGTQFAIDQTNKVRCYYNSGSGWRDGTSDPGIGCVQNPTQLSDGSWNLGTRKLGPFWQMEIMFPLKSTKELKGAGGANGGDRLVGHVESWTSSPTVARPQAFVWVPGAAATAPSVSYPDPSATNVTEGTARTSGYVFNHFKPGNAYFDIGTSTSYGVTSGPIAIPDTADAFIVYQDWAGLSPGTTYHWRMRFVTSSGQTYTGSDQTFRTPGGSDTTAPTVSTPLAALQTGSQLGSTDVPVKVSWSATDVSGISGYDLTKTRFFVNGLATTSTEFLRTNVATAQLAPGPEAYQFEVRAYDNANNSSGPVAGPRFGVGAVQESSGAVRYAGSWKAQSLGDAYGGRVKYSGAKGAAASLSFTGRSVGWVAPRNINRGKAAVYVDGNRAATVDLYSADGLARQVVFSKSWGSSGRHKIEVRVLGLKNAQSGGNRVDLDGFVVLR